MTLGGGVTHWIMIRNNILAGLKGVLFGATCTPHTTQTPVRYEETGLSRDTFGNTLHHLSFSGQWQDANIFFERLLTKLC